MKVASYLSPKTVVKQSGIAGRGLYANTPIARDEIVSVKGGHLIDRATRSVEIYRPGGPVEVLKKPATLSGEDVLPGFVLDLKGILFD